MPLVLSSEDRLVLPLNSVIRGFRIGMQQFKQGGSGKTDIPPGLAYGEPGLGNIIPPNSILTLDIELREII